MKIRAELALAFALVAFAGCQNENPVPKLVPLPISTVSGGEPNLHISDDKQVYLSWVEYLNDTTDALVWSKLSNGAWSAPTTIATGPDWFVNWADFPSLVKFKNSASMAAHWLQISAEGTYDYDVKVSISNNGGQNWNPPFTLHSDGVNAEHGFVSMVPLDDGRIFAAWLDGRNMPGGQEDGHGHGGGPMTLRCAMFDEAGKLSEQAELDGKVCECCTTAAVEIPGGVLVAYRNRSDEENRDIFYTRLQDGDWSNPKAVHNDNWHITGCPVNGPALAASGNTAAIAWFTAPEGVAKVQAAFSTDAGNTFGKPIRIDDGNSAGRVDIVMTDDQTAIVSWLEVVDKKAELRICKVRSDGTKDSSQTIVETSASRSSGFPKMVLNADKLLFAWTEVDSVGTRVRTGEVAF